MRLPHLKELDLSLTGITEESALITALESLPRLVRLDLSAVKVAGDVVLSQLVVPRLERIVFQFMEQLTLASLQSFLRAHKRVQHVDVDHSSTDCRCTTGPALAPARPSFCAAIFCT